MNVNNAPTFLDEQQDPKSTELEVSVLSSFSIPALPTEGDQGPPWFPKNMRKLARVIYGA